MQLMLRRHIINILLAISCLALVALIYFLDNQEQPASHQQQFQPLKKSAVQYIKLQRSGEHDIELIRQQGEWRVSSPIQWPANPARVHALLNLIGENIHGSFKLEETSAQDFGLQSPVVTLSLNQQTILYGDKSPLNQYRYIQANTTVYLLNDSSFYSAAASLERYLSLKLFHPPHNKIDRISMPGVELFKHQGAWKSNLEQPHSMDSLVSFSQYWENSSAVDISLQAPPYTAAGEILIYLSGEKQPTIFTLYLTDEGMILHRKASQLYYHFSAHQRQQLLNLTGQPLPRD
ncbi:MAG: DUF4340 domain-containing protein [Gammaproteobacteria bacterium]|nr:DUF4340 domain-containing protein [Gammaproteobacteria bacterium]